jgi:hypothetical protein
MRQAGIAAFDNCTAFGSGHLRANAFAAIGAAHMLRVDPDHAPASDLLSRTVRIIVEAARARIPWPETRLTYDNARLPEALLVAGTVSGDRRLIDLALRLLEWLVGVETIRDHFSFTPAVGWTPGEPRPGFDQQPIEAAAMAEACYRAWSVTGESIWMARALRAVQWLFGRNDTGMTLYDPDTGATSDGLMRDSVNQNRGAESTLAGLTALQVAALCALKPDVPLPR